MLLYSKKSDDGMVKSLPRPSTESDIWVPDHLTPSWVCLPNDQPVLTIIQPGESALCVLETICKVKTHGLEMTRRDTDHTARVTLQSR